MLVKGSQEALSIKRYPPKLILNSNLSRSHSPYLNYWIVLKFCIEHHSVLCTISERFTFVRGNHQSTTDSLTKRQYCGHLIFSLMLARTNWWRNNGFAGDFQHHDAHTMECWTHWSWKTHIYVSKLIIIGSENSLSPGQRQTIIWINAGILLIEPLRTNFS